MFLTNRPALACISRHSGDGGVVIAVAGANSMSIAGLPGRGNARGCSIAADVARPIAFSGVFGAAQHDAGPHALENDVSWRRGRRHLLGRRPTLASRRHRGAIRTASPR